MAGIGPIVASVIAICFIGRTESAQYLGKFLGKLSELHHGVSGEVYAVDGRTLHIKDFTYDGQGPAAYFYASNYKVADSRGFRLRDENSNGDVIRRYRKEGLTLTLPEGKTLNSIKIFYVWCEEFDVNFGDVKIPRNFDYPRPQKIDPLKGVHAISSDNIVLVDAQTLLIPNLSYDGEAPDAKFWVGRGPKPSPQGIRVPDENGKEVPLRRYDRKTVVLTLPGDLTVFDIGHFGIWCEQFTVDFGHIQIPQNINIPPSLKMLGVSPQSKLNCEVLNDDLAFEVRWAVAGESIVLQLVAKLDRREYMSFGISGDDSNSVMIGGDVVVAWIDKDTLKGYAEDYYLADKSQCSGPTGSCPDNRLAENTNNIRLLNAAMVNGYSIVTYQRPLKPSDQYDRQIYTNHSQPIIWAIGPLNERNEVSFHSSYPKRDSFIDFARPAKWNCPMPESEQPPMRTIHLESKLAKVAEEEVAPAPVPATSAPRSRNSERRRGGGNRGSTRPSASSEDDTQRSGNGNRGSTRQSASSEDDSQRSASQTRTRGGNRGSQRRENAVKAVPTPTPVKKRDAWYIPPIKCDEPDDGVFYAQMGPTGGKRGYPAITGHVGWGISWYINGLLIPEVNVVRGKTYNFVVEGGSDPEVSAKYHPFYITDDPVGGYEYKTQEEKDKVRLFAGVSKAKDGSVHPTGTGRLCHWTQTGDKDADDFESFGAYQRTLELKCDRGEPGLITWTPDKNTPDTVYYQCFTHRYLGWKINVVDSCDEQSAASELQPSIIRGPENKDQEFLAKSDDIELEESPSIRVETRVKPNTIIIEDIKEDNIKPFQYAVSEKNTHPIQLAPNAQTNAGQPQEQLPNEPILIQPQQSFFDPFYQQNNEPYFAPQTLNPYTFESLYNHHYNQHYFKPSTVLDEEPHEPPSSSSTTTTTTSTTTTTKKPSSTTTVTPERLAAPSQSRLVITNNSTHPSTSKLPPKSNSNVIYRVPSFSKRPQFSHPMKIPMRHHQMIRQHAPHTMTFKKPMFRPVMKMHAPNRPMYLSNPMLLPKIQSQPTSFLVNKPTVITKSPPIQNQLVGEIVKTEQVINVEVSPQQASTEREPEIQTASPSLASSYNQYLSNLRSTFTADFKREVNTDLFKNNKPEKEPEIQTASSTSMAIAPSYSRLTNLKPAYNTGFKPETVVVEGGFKPIVSKEAQDRMDDEDIVLDLESEAGVVKVEGESKFESSSPIENFEPMFVPSPADKTKTKQKFVKVFKRPLTKKRPYKLIIQPRSLVDSPVEPVASAAERVESYYLPPLGQTQKPVDVVRQPSEIDIEVPSNLDLADSPPDVVVTYDGKRVSGQSLTAKPFDRSSILEQRASKAAEFIKARPQFGPFKGELPPLLNPEFFNKNAPQLQASHVGTLSRDLEIPSVPSLPPQGTTKLHRVREKREAHHTPEHTAQQEQERQRNGTKTSSANHLVYSIHVHVCIIVVALLPKIFIKSF